LAKQRNQSTALFDISKLLTVKPLTENQTRVFDAFLEGYNLILSGNAGTGKSFLALYLALKSLLLKKYERVVIFPKKKPRMRIVTELFSLNYYPLFPILTTL
jgi:predicted ribonuclease YlaK